MQIVEKSLIILYGKYAGPGNAPTRQNNIVICTNPKNAPHPYTGAYNKDKKSI